VGKKKFSKFSYTGTLGTGKNEAQEKVPWEGKGMEYKVKGGGWTF